MFCIKCRKKMKTIESRPRPGNVRKRVYSCLECDFMATTTERFDEQHKKPHHIKNPV